MNHFVTWIFDCVHFMFRFLYELGRGKIKTLYTRA